MSTFTSHGPRPAPYIRKPAAPRFVCIGHPQPPSVRHGVRWRALPVEGSRAHRNSSKRSGALLAHLKGLFA